MSPVNRPRTPPLWQKPTAVLLLLLPTVNAVLLSIQAFIAEPPYNAAVPGWVFAAVNAAVTVAALAAKLLSHLMANPLVSAWIRKLLLQAGEPVRDGGPQAPGEGCTDQVEVDDPGSS